MFIKLYLLSGKVGTRYKKEINNMAMKSMDMQISSVLIIILENPESYHTSKAVKKWASYAKGLKNDANKSKKQK